MLAGCASATRRALRRHRRRRDRRVERNLANHETRVTKPGEREGESGRRRGPSGAISDRPHTYRAPLANEPSRAPVATSGSRTALEVADAQRQPPGPADTTACRRRRAPRIRGAPRVIEAAAEQPIDLSSARFQGVRKRRAGPTRANEGDTTTGRRGSSGSCRLSPRFERAITASANAAHARRQQRDGRRT